jgi:hypothetical protein
MRSKQRLILVADKYRGFQGRSIIKLILPFSENCGVNTSSLVVNVLNFSKGYQMTILIDSIKAVTEILNFKQRKAHGSSFGR